MAPIVMKAQCYSEHAPRHRNHSCHFNELVPRVAKAQAGAPRVRLRYAHGLRQRLLNIFCPLESWNPRACLNKILSTVSSSVVTSL